MRDGGVKMPTNPFSEPPAQQHPSAPAAPAPAPPPAAMPFEGTTAAPRPPVAPQSPAFAQPPAAPRPPLVTGFDVPAQQAARGRGAVLMFSAPKGGTGKTTVATNVAAFIALHSTKKVVYIDFNVRQGDALLRLGLGPSLSNRQTFKTVEDLYRNIANVTPETIEHYLMPHRPTNEHQFFVLLPPPNVHAHDMSIYDDVFFEKAIGIMRQAFDYIIIDTGSFESDNKLHVLAERLADRVCWVLSQETSSSVHLQKLLQQYNEMSRLHYPYPKHGWILNARIDNKDVGVSAEQLIASLSAHGPLFGSLPHDFSFQRASNLMELIVTYRKPDVDAAFRDIITEITRPEPIPSVKFPELEHLSPTNDKGGLLGGLKRLFGG